jgi:hypothetical protein
MMDDFLHTELLNKNQDNSAPTCAASGSGENREKLSTEVNKKKQKQLKNIEKSKRAGMRGKKKEISR